MSQPRLRSSSAGPVAAGLEQLPRVDADPDPAQLALPGLAQLAPVLGDEGDLLEGEHLVRGRERVQDPVVDPVVGAIGTA